MKPDFQLSNVMADITSVVGKTPATEEESQGRVGACTCIHLCVRGREAQRVIAKQGQHILDKLRERIELRKLQHPNLREILNMHQNSSQSVGDSGLLGSDRQA